MTAVGHSSCGDVWYSIRHPLRHVVLHGHCRSRIARSWWSAQRRTNGGEHFEYDVKAFAGNHVRAPAKNRPMRVELVTGRAVGVAQGFRAVRALRAVRFCVLPPLVRPQGLDPWSPSRD
jgi:hypothetical protein